MQDAIIDTYLTGVSRLITDGEHHPNDLRRVALDAYNSKFAGYTKATHIKSIENHRTRLLHEWQKATAGNQESNSTTAAALE